MDLSLKSIPMKRKDNLHLWEPTRKKRKTIFLSTTESFRRLSNPLKSKEFKGSSKRRNTTSGSFRLSNPLKSKELEGAFRGSSKEHDRLEGALDSFDDLKGNHFQKPKEGNLVDSDFTSSDFIRSNAYKLDDELKVKNVDGDSHAQKDVKKIVKLYHEILDNLRREIKKTSLWDPSIHKKAVKELQNHCNWLNMEKQVGSIPGVEIGDGFQYRAELFIVGIHNQYQNGIDYLEEKDGTTLATSVVVTSRYANSLNSGVLIYLGEGGNPRVVNNRPLKDQAMKRGNLALKNSMEQKSPVRVIYRLHKSLMSSKINYCSQRMTPDVYVYDGLYLVEKFRQVRGEFGKLVFKFMLRRIPGQSNFFPGFLSEENKESSCNKKSFSKDISKGKENVSIVLVNERGNDKPIPFTYITDRMCCTVPLQSLSNGCHGCDCVSGCSNIEDCSCKIKNGKAFAYDYTEHIVEKKQYIYKCGTSCKCFKSCINRVSQRKIRFQLEVFKIEYKGWGVRSRVHIPAGSFICEYVGEVFKTEDVKQRICPNDYLFDIESDDGEDYTIDATRCGNVGRFINHSCFPNLFVQSVIYVDRDGRLPHVMLFAMRDIPILEELTYDYKHRLGELRFNNGDFKEERCDCQSPNCIGKFYC